MNFDEIFSWIPLAIWTVLMVGAGRHYERETQRRRERELKQRDSDLGVLLPLLGELQLGVKSRAQADEEMRRSHFKSAASLWFSMREEERVELGKRAIALTEDPTFMKQSEQNTALLRGMLN